eukprot:878906-Pelagomonas_calceolata.AAC.1
MSEGGAVTVSPKVELSLTAAVSDYGGPFLDLRKKARRKHIQQYRGVVQLSELPESGNLPELNSEEKVVVVAVKYENKSKEEHVQQ